MAKLTDYNTAEWFETNIREKAEEIRRLCIQQGIPCFLAFGLISNTLEERAAEQSEQPQRESYLPKENGYDTETFYVTKEGIRTLHTEKDTVVSDVPYDLKCIQAIPEILPDFFYDRRFSDFINIINAFRAVPRAERVSTDMEEEVIHLPDVEFQKELLGIAESMQVQEE